MNTWTKRVIGVSLALAVALGAVGIAAAQGPGQPDYPRAYRVRLVDTLVQTVKELTGLSWSDVLPELRAGQTLTEILEANGADSQAVRDAVGAAVTAEIEEAVAAGTLTQEQADELLAVLPDWLANHFESPSWFAGSEVRTGMMLHRFSGFRDGMSGRFGGFREGVPGRFGGMRGQPSGIF